MIRENVEAAVFAFFSALTVGGSPAFKTATRKVKHWEDVQSEDQPALLLRSVNQRSEKRKGLPARWWLNYELFIYVSTEQQSDPTVIPSQILNPLIDAIDNALAADDLNTDSLTLGGLASHCAINGTIEIFEGHLGNEAVVIVPIEVLVTGN